MLIAGLDTGGEQGCVGLQREGRPLSEIAFSAALKQGEKLLPALDAALKLAGSRRGELELLAVSIGPGSFTSLRIGIATAKGLARALKIPIVGVSTIEAYARAADFWEGPVWVLLVDRRDWVYAAGYHQGKLLAPVQTVLLETLMQKLESPEGLLFIGPGAEEHRARLRARFGPRAVAPPILNRPSGLQMARLGWETYQRSGHDEFYELEPHYLTSPPPPLRIGEGWPKAGVR